MQLYVIMFNKIKHFRTSNLLVFSYAMIKTISSTRLLFSVSCFVFKPFRQSVCFSILITCNASNVVLMNAFYFTFNVK